MFEKYKANVKFFIGDLDRYVEKGEILEYDIETTQLKIGSEVKNAPKIISVIEQDWLSKTTSSPTTRKPVANTTSSPEKNSEKNKTYYTTTEEERVLAPVSDRKNLQKEANALIVGERGWTEKSVTAKVSNPEKQGNFRLDDVDRPRRVMPVLRDDDERVSVQQIGTPVASRKDLDLVSDNDGVAVKTRRLSTLTKEKTTLDGSSLSIPEPQVVVEPVYQTPRREKVAASSEESSFHWDTSLHYKKRIKLAVEEYGDKPEILNHILEVESPSVADTIREKIDSLK